MRLTLRGWIALAVVAFSLWASASYGPRSLNAVVVPLVIVVIAAIVAIVRVGRPSVRRRDTVDGFVDDRATVAHEIESDSTVAATLSDPVGEGLTPGEASVRTTRPDDADRITRVRDSGPSTGAGTPTVDATLEAGVDHRFEYELALEERGERTVGPLSIVVTDVFGLVERRFEDDATTTVLVYPRVRELCGVGTERLLAAAVDREREQRREFDHLREYRRGDSLRDVHWKSTAKRADDGLFVTEYVADDDVGSATIAAECRPGREDELTTAVASVANFLLEAGVNVGLVLPGDQLAPDGGPDHRRALLRALAVADAGELEDDVRRRADVVVRSERDETTVAVGSEELPFDRLRDGPTGRGADPSSGVTI
ncbi:DUF58 domain-containing protein [Natrarchaeobius oligotrophus]|uniref:DUF58 domain-containing protein n=1 Tax=Natrarchaeobius chitinivorans TaxID=1679083 RepID=A0A3N6MXS1_NATCH|nr:DUF58 domain-containing protein [Natrarchaeobius chitinivorans]RQH01222.1 DUF58 domain-containing protein [Natrarchaeobius chitinivorans]